jgi:hypothetical protein
MTKTIDEKMQDRDGFDTWRCVVDVLAALDRALSGA